MGFLNPAALLFSSLIAVLIALYLWEKQRRRVDVPSLLLWEAVPDAVIRTSRFRPDLLFFLQLALLSLLILGFARPYLSRSGTTDTGRRHVFVLDTSASMQAREEKGDSRFDRARDELLRRISALSAGDEAMLVTAASYPRVVVPFSHDHTALTAKVRALVPVDTGTHLEPALALARRAAAREHPTRIAIFTDLEPSRLATGSGGDVEVFRVGRSDDNLALDGLEVFQGRFQDPREASARVTIHNYSRRDQHGFLSIRLDDEVISRRGFSLSSRETRSFPVRNFPHSGVVHAALEVDDALAVDNHAFGWVRPLESIKLAVVSGPSPLRVELERIAQAVPNLNLQFLSPAEYQQHPPVDADALLFEEYVPAEEPTHPSLYVHPGRDGSWFSVAGNERLLPVVNWDEGHPALGNLHPQFVFPLSDVRIIRLPDWAEVLLSANWRGREVPLAFTAERNRRRLAGISFDLAAEGLLSADNVNLLLLFLSLLDWLLPSDSQVVVQRTGEVYTFPDSSTGHRRIVDPVAVASEFRPGESLRIELLHAGEYRVETGDQERRLFANFVDPIESDIGRRAGSAIVAPVATDSTTPPNKSPFGGWLYAMAAMLFVAEWIVAARS